MIVINRRVGQAVAIGDNIVVRVVDLVGDKVRLAVSGPPGTTVRREEQLVAPNVVVQTVKPGSKSENPR